MALPGRTFDTKVMIGQADWFVDLTEAVNSMSVNASTNITRQPVMGVRNEDAINNSTTHSFDITTIYVGPETEALRARQTQRKPPWMCVFDYNKDADPKSVGLADVTDGLLIGVGENAPTADAIATSINFPQGSRVFGDGKSMVVRFELKQGVLSASLGDIPAGKNLFLIVDETNITISKDLEISGHADVVEQAVTDEGIWHLGKLANARTSAEISVDALMNQTINGYVLIVEEVDP